MTMGIAKIARRTFLIGAAAIAGGVAVGYYYVSQPWDNPLKNEVAPGEATFNPWVKIAADDTITVIVPRAEMGQGVQTTLAALVAEELDVALDRVKVEHGPGSFAYYNSAMIEDGGPFAFFDESFLAETMRSAAEPISRTLGLQVTGGSSSTRDAFDKMRKAGAATRHVLVAAAAAQWGVDASSLSTENGFVVETSGGRRASYGSLALAASAIKPPSDPALKPSSEWKLLGKPQMRTDMLAKVTGTAEFGVDVKLPDMLYGTVRMSPRFGAKPKSVDDSEALKVKGVLKVVPINARTGSGFGVIAENTWAAFKGAEALVIEWEDAAYPATSAEMFSALRDQLSKPADFSLRDDGDVTVAFADAPREDVIEAEYEAPFVAHACMEPMNATARWKDGILEIWAPNQAPAILQMVTAPLVGVEAKDVRVHTTFLGGGFGRRAEPDFPTYAVELAKVADGRPVKVVWTREEDIRHDAYRPAAVARMKARIVKGEGPAAVDMAIASTSVIASVIGRTFPSISPMGPDKTLTEGAHDQPYKIASYRVSGHKRDLGVPVGFWRSVGNSYNGFFHEGFIDEIAKASGVDPLDMRLKLMADYPAALGALKKVAEMSGWGRDPGAGRGLGIAHTLSFGTWVAEVAEVSVSDNGVRIEKIWCAAEIGQALDPEIIKAQMMSGVVYGLSAAMGQEITFDAGEVQQSNFFDHDAMRMSQCPKIEVAVLETYHRMGGAGEPGTPPSIPALANAIHAATGKRMRTMPFNREVKFA
jgi:isoquinoline 1-oxidoreductase beta subunit